MRPLRLSAGAAGWVKRGIVWLALCAVVLLRFADPEPLPTFRNAFFDFAQGLIPADPAASQPPLTIVDIDEASLAAVGQWPWPRDTLGDLVSAIGAHRPRVLGINIIFPEPDRLSPENLLQRFPMDAPLRESLAELPSNDAVFAFSLNQVPAVLGAAVTEGAASPSSVSELSAPVLLRLGQQGAAEIRRYPGLLRNLPILEQASQGIGVVSLEYSGDGVVRRMPIVMLVGDSVVPSFAVEVVRVAKQVPAISVEIEGPGISSVTLGDLVIRTAFSGEVWLHEVRLEAIDRVSAVTLLRGEADASRLEGRVVLLGATGSGLSHGFVTPSGAAMAAIDVQAAFVQNLLSDSYLLRPPFIAFWETSLTAALFLGFLAAVGRLPGYVSLLSLAAVLMLLFGGALYAFDRHGLLVDPTYPFFIFAMTYVVMTALGMVEAQRQRRRSEQEREMALILAEAANRSKTSFLANMSHELRTPLNAILGFSEMMKREILGPVSPPKYRDYVQDIHHMGMHLLSLVNDILEMSKVEAGESQLSESEFQVGEVVDDGIRTVSAAFRDHSTTIVLDHQSVLPSLCADRRMFTQMVLNLMSNAVKYTPKSGRVRVVGVLAENGCFRLSVSDTGIGMTDQEVVEAFEPFRRVDHALASNFEGIGLGLPLTKAMVEMHGGKLEIASISNHGTTATLVFPAERVRGPSERQRERA
ncbi:CHASE2 domain-containing protein [Pelagibius sp. CAU 1746]|uniref:CHASE2 domain-containing protein n=1 Tax=Pelagibius sp. CAU 1746 TaxID=3140370 RepID=UPI00325AECC8